jgi:hypothetical protein
MLQVDVVVVTARGTARFPGAAVMAGRCGIGGGDGRVDDAVFGHGGDDNGGRGGCGIIPGAVVKAEEERDGSILSRGDEGWADDGEGVDPTTAAMTAWRRLGWR